MVIQNPQLQTAVDRTTPVFRHEGRCDYLQMHARMQKFTHDRGMHTQDEVWFVQHEPVFTLGRNGSRQHILSNIDIPVLQSDRGGDVTYHGPGQLLVYCLFDLARLELGVKALVRGFEDIIIEYLSGFKIVAARLNKAPGVYVDNKKIASLGLRVRRGCSFHGLAINVDMDLQPFSCINPCGLEGMQVTQLSDLGIQHDCNEVASRLESLITRQFYS